MTERELPWLAPRAALQLVSQLGLGRGDGLQHGLQLPLCDDEVERRRDRGHLRGVALRAVGLRRVRVYLGGGGVGRVGHARAQAQRLRWRDADDALLQHGLVNDVAVGIGRRDVRHLTHRLDDGRVPRRLRVGRVRHEVEAVGDLARLGIGVAVARRLGRPELALVRVGRLVQVDVARPLLDLKRRQQRQQRATLLGGRLGVERAAGHHLAVWVEGAVRVDRLRVPPLHRLVSPRADTGHDQQVEDGAVRRARRLQEEQRALDAACLVSVHAAGHQRSRLVHIPIAALDSVERVAARVVRQRTVVQNLVLGPLTQRVKLCHHLLLVRTVQHPLGQPLLALVHAPRLAMRANVVGDPLSYSRRRRHHRAARDAAKDHRRGCERA
mmetsp:Transcript_13368/g.31522  ORF Transcript_13368/g.31522 Transcript_13368/m.31522 type:complete len:383 (+) Transcript_13368:195-1343(+)